jgi:LacI family transcriptional regulator, galactose operon repressor
MGVTIIDVAREAGTSKSTVSNVLHGDPHVARETRARVLSAIDRLGYRPNRAAQNLVRGTTHAIGIVVSDLLNPFYPRLIQSIDESAKAMGFTTVLVEAEFDIPDRIAEAERLLSGLVDGILFAASWGAPDSVTRLQASGVPFAVVTSRPSGADVDYVVVDDRLGAGTAIDHLLGLGHRRIGHIMGAEPDSSMDDRRAGYVAALEAAGIARDDRLIVQATRRTDLLLDCEAAVEQLLAVDPAPTAIFCANDAIAMQVLGLIERRGRRVPEDISVVGFDDAPMAGHPRIALTTIAQPIAEIAGRATAWVIDRGHDGTGPAPLRVVLPAPLIVRATSGPLRNGAGKGNGAA